MRQKRINSSARFAISLSLLAAGLLMLAGCGDARLPLYPVTGTITVDGKPVEKAMVILCPVEGTSSPELQRERPFGNTGPDGKFNLTTFTKDDGVPLGEYKILVQWLGGPPSADAARDGGGAGSDRFRGKYMNLETTPFSATISEETVELPPIDLKSR